MTSSGDEGMKKSWSWSDYELLGSPTIAFEDYRIKAYGRDEEIAVFVDELVKYCRRSTRMLRKLVAYWGTGKSTYLYNVCYNVNSRLFFGDEVENAKDGKFQHALAFFESAQAVVCQAADLAANCRNLELPLQGFHQALGLLR